MAWRFIGFRLHQLRLRVVGVFFHSLHQPEGKSLPRTTGVVRKSSISRLYTGSAAGSDIRHWHGACKPPGRHGVTWPRWQENFGTFPDGKHDDAAAILYHWQTASGSRMLV